MTTHDQDNVVDTAIRAGLFSSIPAPQLLPIERFYAIAYEAGAASSDAEVDRLGSELDDCGESLAQVKVKNAVLVAEVAELNLRYEKLLNIAALRETEQQEKLAEANHAHEFMSKQYDAAIKERDQLREQVAMLQHTIDEEAKDSAQVIIERDRLRNHVLLLRSCVEQSTEYRTGNPAYEHALFATEPK